MLHNLINWLRRLIMGKDYYELLQWRREFDKVHYAFCEFEFIDVLNVLKRRVYTTNRDSLEYITEMDVLKKTLLNKKIHYTTSKTLNKILEGYYVLFSSDGFNRLVLVRDNVDGVKCVTFLDESPRRKIPINEISKEQLFIEIDLFNAKDDLLLIKKYD